MKSSGMAFAPRVAVDAGAAASAGVAVGGGVGVGMGVAVGIGVAVGAGVGNGAAVGAGAGLGAHAAKSTQSGASRMRGGSGGKGIRMLGIVVDGARRGNGGGRVFMGARALRLLIIRAYGDTGMPIFGGKAAKQLLGMESKAGFGDWRMLEFKTRGRAYGIDFL